MNKLLFLFFTLIFIVFFLLINYYNLIRFKIDNIIHYNPRLSTQILDTNGKLIANIFDKEHRFYVNFEDIPSRVIEAILSIEDTSFFEHNGVNLEAILRALIKDLKARKIVEGASTLTQQLIKNVILSRDKKIQRKLKEILLAFSLETYLTKEEILERYLNEIYLGHGYYGVKTAAKGYFDKGLDELSLKEIAILMGLPKAPSFYDPTRNYELSLGRANRVINRMYNLGWINKEEYYQALKERPKVYNQTLTKNKAPYVVDELIRRLEPHIDNLKIGGYKIHTTIDLELQDLARSSLKYAYDLSVRRVTNIYKDSNASYIEKLNGAMVVLDIESGGILALVGGIDYKQSSFNRASQSKRQAGSSIKPIIYQMALEQGYSGLSKLADVPKTYSYELNGETKYWRPNNYKKNFKGIVTLKSALVHSINLATVSLVDSLGFKNVYSNFLRYGFKNIPYDFTISLGSFAVSPLKMSEAYTIISAGGVKREPLLIKKISNMNGDLEEYEAKKEYLSLKEQSFLNTMLLKDVVLSGTGRRAYVKGIELAGKTGTTNDNMDAWFCGFSPTIQTVVWFGNDDNKPMFKYETGGRVTGPAFSKFYKELIKRRPEIKRTFDMPSNVIKMKINGRDEYFTNISKPPKNSNLNDNKSKLIF